MALQVSLNDYYDNYVYIAPDRMTSAKAVAEEVGDKLLEFLKQKPTIPVTKIVGAGSAYQGLKVIGPDEFDMELMLKVPGLRVQDDGLVPDYTLIEMTEDGLPEFRIQKGRYSCLNPQKVISDFQGKITKFVHQYKKPSHIKDVSVRTQGPALTLDIKHGRGRSMSVDFVPVVVIGKKQLVAKPHHSRDSYKEYWRYSFSNQERHKLDSLPQRSCHRKVLQTFKAIRTNHHAQFGMLRTYLCKTVLLHLMDRKPGLDWSQEQFAQRFDDYMVALRDHLDKQNLPHYFVDSVNLLDPKIKTVSLGKLSDFITRAKRNNYADLLKKRGHISHG